MTRVEELRTGEVLLPHVLACLAALGAATALALALPAIRRRLVPLEVHLRRELRFVRAPVSAEALLVLGGLSVLLGVCFSVVDVRSLLGAALPLLVFALLLARGRRSRVRRIEQQVEGFLGALARSLEAAPSLGDALAEAARVVDPPLAEELRETLHELTLGRTLEEALERLGERVGSRMFSLALVTLEVGRTTGGRLPTVLRSAAAALREMQRLEGVLRTKTADGRAQAVVIGVVPLPLYFGLRVMDPSYFVPLETTTLGHALLGLSVALWLAAVLLTQKILAVDL